MCLTPSSFTSWFSCHSTGKSKSHQQSEILNLHFYSDFRRMLAQHHLLQTCSNLCINPLNAELYPICYLLALLGAHHFLHLSRIRVKSLTLRLLMSYIYIYIYDISRLRVNYTLHINFNCLPNRKPSPCPL